jgi:acetyl-CoA acyltransferase
VRAAETLAPGAVLDFIRPNGRICDWHTGLARGRDPDIDTLAEAVICDGVRTPIGRYGGALSHVRTDDLAAIPIRALLDRNPSLPPERIDEVLLGDANQAGEDNRNVARMAALLAGLPVTVPGVTLNRLCASGMDAVGFAARGIRAGDYSIAIAGGVESMTRAPFVMPKPGAAWSRQAEVHDTTIGWRFVNPAMATAYGTDSMPQTADNVAADYGISRADQDAFALRSQERWARADAAGVFREEIVPVTIPRRKGDPLVVDRDEHPRPDTTADALAKLRGINGPELTVTAGNASGVNDGAAALLIASREAAEAHGLTPVARILGMASAGVEPRVMGIGPVEATRKLLDRLGLTIGQMDVIELNEAFASQALATLRALGVPDDAAHVNPNGGAIALGHPLGMSGARLVLTAAHHLRLHGGVYGLCTMCVGVGQGTAMVIERV